MGLLGEMFQAVPADPLIAGIESGEEAGPGGAADGTLAVGPVEGNPFGAQSVKVRCGDVRVVDGPNGVVALLVGADPEDVWSGDILVPVFALLAVEVEKEQFWCGMHLL